MKPQKLIMNAFGAYADEQVIDFSLLGDKTFFLIHGPTGSGKTTVLDAISFALYGTASGDLRESKNLRSDYAPPSTKTQVDFTFRSGEKEYQVVRSPEQEVAKQRGEGVRKLPAAAALYELAGEDRNVLASGTNDVTKQIENILGFKAEQFRQIVLLPQGEFRRFLISESKERKSILETLFKTGIYRQIEALLAEKSKMIEQEYENIKKEQSFLLDTASCENKDALSSQKDNLLSEQKFLQEKFALTKQKLEEAKAAHLAAQALAKAFSEAELAQKAQSLLLAQSEEIKSKKIVLENAERAALVEPYYNACQKAFLRQSEAQKQQENAQKALSSAHAKAKLLQDKLAAVLPPNISNPADELQKLLSTTVTDLQKAKGGILVFDKLASAQKTESELAKKLALYSEKLLKVGQEEKAAGEHLKKLQILQIESLAGHLANSLHEGQPCPVCGSTNHPRPALDSVTEDIDVEAGEKMFAEAARAVVTATGTYKSAEAQLTAQKEQVRVLRSEIGEFAFQDKQSLEEFLAAQQKKEKELQALQKEHNDLQVVLSRVQADADSAEKYLTEANAAFEESRDEYKNRLGDNGFAEQSAFLAARKTSAEQAELKRAVSSYEQQAVSAQDRLTRALAAIAGKENPSLSEFAEAENNAAALQQEVSNRLAVLGRELTQATELLERLGRLEDRGKILEETYKNTSSLAQTARGDNSRRLTFSGFVLQAILDDVLQAANLRLSQMSRGRYNLSRLDEVTDARRESGLNIEVMDSFTGVSRPVKTLSGGEIFLASLSLALGLSDVVQAYAGGIRLDTILVDEGFGSLDPESLDMAIRTLTDLQKGGRLVGIISHVSELRERINTRLEIIPGPRGSSASFRI